MAILTHIDILGIQRFVFSSTRLSDVLAGSLLVQQATDKFLDDARDGSGEVLLNGGGNALLRFDTLDEAKVFAGKYTRMIFDRAPGLDAAIVHEEIGPDGVIATFKKMLEIMFKNKPSRRAQLPFVGLGVTESCRETGLPATTFDKEDNPISRIVSQRHSDEIEKMSEAQWSIYLNKANKHFKEQGFSGTLAFPKDLDKMGRERGEQSLMGVVHVDANDMGQRMQEVMKELEKMPDDEGLKTLQTISKSIDKMAEAAFTKCVMRVVKAIKLDDKGNYVVQRLDGRESFKLTKENGLVYLPLRPILIGGDDLTFVCDARIALDLAETALKTIETTEIPKVGTFTASAGVAITGVHVPFARVYERAEHLCGNAKRWRHAKDIDDSVIDWHIETTQSIGDITSIRRKTYNAIGSGDFQEYRLTFRPYRLDAKSKCDIKRDGPTWTWLSRTFLASEDGLQGKKWSARRSKIHELEMAVRSGKYAVKEIFSAWKRLDPSLKLPPALEDGYIGNRTPVIDATELENLYYLLG